MKLVKAWRDGMNVEAIADGRAYVAKPEGWERPGFWEAVKRAFSLKYRVYDREGLEVCQIHYDFVHGSILVKRPVGDRELKLPIFETGSGRYYMKEKVTGFIIWPLVDGGKIVISAEGEKSLKDYTLLVNSDDEKLDPLVLELSIGYMIRWMCFNIGV
ncbi:MAG: hypothetical protein V1934_01425 [Methanobacteriota archaeon]